MNASKCSLSQPIQPPVDMRPAIIELLYAARGAAVFLVERGECVCGTVTGDASEPSNHTRLSCPVARVYAAIESVREVLL